MGVLPTKTTADPELRATAYHEAGHAIAHVALGRPFRSVSVRPEGDTLGRVTGLLTLLGAGVDLDGIVIALAGPAAERLALRARSVRERERIRSRCRDDYTLALDLAREREDGVRRPHTILDHRIVEGAEDEAASLVFAWFVHVEAVAEQLLKRETLTWSEVTDIVRDLGIRSRETPPRRQPKTKAKARRA